MNRAMEESLIFAQEAVQGMTCREKVSISGKKHFFISQSINQSIIYCIWLKHILNPVTKAPNPMTQTMAPRFSGGGGARWMPCELSDVSSDGYILPPGSEAAYFCISVPENHEGCCGHLHKFALGTVRGVILVTILTYCGGVICSGCIEMSTIVLMPNLWASHRHLGGRCWNRMLNQIGL